MSSIKIDYPKAEKILVKFNDVTQMQPGAGVLISRDEKGENVIALKMESQAKKDH
jgi:hypothetical protein